MKKVLLILLPVLLCMGRLMAQTINLSPATQSVTCNNGLATINVSGHLGALYYVTVNGGLVISDNGVDKSLLISNQPSFKVKAASGDGRVIVTLVARPNVSDTVEVGVSAMNVGSITGNTCMPAQGTATFTIPAIAGASYLWQIVAGGQHTRILSGGNTNTVTVESLNEGNSGLRVYVYNQCTGDICAAIQRGVTIRKIFTLSPTETFGGPACMDQSVLGADSVLVFSVAPYLGLYNTFNDYVWTLSPGLRLLYRSADGSSLSLKVEDASADQQISVQVGPCNAPGNTLTKILKAPAPAPTFASSAFCISDASGTQATFSVTNNPQGKYSYRWILPDNWTPVSANGQDSTQVTVQFNNASPGNITVVASNAGCGAKFSDFSVNRYPATVPVIAGETCIAYGNTTSQTYTVQGGNNTYTWEVVPANAGWTVSPGNGPSILIIPSFGNIPSNGEVEIRATIQGNCGTAPVTSSRIVKIGPAQPDPISGLACVPYGTTSSVYSISNVSRATGYQWTVPPGWSVNGNTNGTSIDVNTNNVNGTLSVVALGCSSGTSSAARQITVTVGPNIPGNISGPACVPYGTIDGIEYSIGAVPNAQGYQWIIPPGWTSIVSPDQRTIAITSTNNTSGNVQVRALGCSEAAHSAYRTLAVSVGPPQPGTITGPTCITNNGNQTYSITPVANAAGYSWTFPAGWTINSSPSNTASINVTPGSSGGDVTVVALGCSAGTNSLPQALAVTVAPAQPGPISYYVGSNTSNTCIGKGAAQSVTFSIPVAVPGAISYTWTFPAAWGGAAVTTTSLSITQNTDATNGGTISVKANGPNLCSGLERSITVVRSGLEFCVSVAPIFTGSKIYSVDPALISNGTPTYFRWYTGTPGNLAAEGVDAYGVLASNSVGTVRVEITDANGCVTSFNVSTGTPVNTSACNYTIPAPTMARTAGTRNTSVAGEQEVKGNLQLFPNPANDKVSIELPAHISRGTVMIYSTSGTLVGAMADIKQDAVIDVSSYAEGTYYILINTSSGVLHNKFIVQH